MTATLLIACEETEIPIPQSSAPTVSIMSPLASDSAYVSGQSLLLQVQFDDDDELHEIVVTIIRLSDGAMIYQRNLHQHGNSYRWIDNLELTTSVQSDFEVRAIVTDHELQRTEDSQTITVLPE